MSEYFYKANKKYSKGSYEEAIELYTKSIENKEREKDCLYNIGVCLLKLEKYKEAKSYFKKANSFRLENRNFYNLGFCCVKLEDFGGALYNFVCALELDQDDYESIQAVRNVNKHIVEKEGIIKDDSGKL